MKIKFLGTAGYMPTEFRHTNCVMLPEEGIVLDAGTGFFRVKENIETEKLDILLSHYHPDHIFGLTFMLGQFYKSDLDVNIYGPKDIKDLEKKLSFPIKFKDHPFEISLKKIKKKFYLDDVLVKTMLFPHSDQVSVGYRLEKDGKVVCYVTDLTAVDDEINFVKEADVLIHECYFNERNKKFAELTSHSYTTKVAEIAKKADVNCLMLYHINPLIPKEYYADYIQECQEIFENTILPKDNWEVII